MEFFRFIKSPEKSYPAYACDWNERNQTYVFLLVGENGRLVLALSDMIELDIERTASENQAELKSNLARPVLLVPRQ